VAFGSRAADDGPVALVDDAAAVLQDDCGPISVTALDRAIVDNETRSVGDLDAGRTGLAGRDIRRVERAVVPDDAAVVEQDVSAVVIGGDRAVVRDRAISSGDLDAVPGTRRSRDRDRTVRVVGDLTAGREVNTVISSADRAVVRNDARGASDLDAVRA
jgi:hypothetical protein